MPGQVAIVGAGLCGNLAAIMLARRGFAVSVYDRGVAPGSAEQAAGRSINLALAARGIRALEHAEAFAATRPLLLPMNGRIVHEQDGRIEFLAYGQRREERIWSVSRAELNARLYTIARDRWRVDYRFGHSLEALDAASLAARFETPTGTVIVESDLLLAADGAGSTVRRSLAEAGILTASEELLDHGYKELVVPPTPAGEFALAPEGLHIWPRGGFMLIALPNLDRSFTATLFLPRQGELSFETLAPERVEGLFGEQFPDALPLLPELVREFRERPVGTLGTVHCAPYGHAASDGSGRHVLLIGDAAHAIVPFHGQGMNAAFEDCAELDRLVGATGADWAVVVARFEAARRLNAEAIATMALENYVEMRQTVRSADFARRAALAFELERRCAGRFIPRYSMVMFHPEIAYADALERGRIQAEILDSALAAGDDEKALSVALGLVEQKL